MAQVKKSKKIVQMVLDSGVVLFTDQFSDGFMSLDGTGQSVIRLKSKAFEQWLSNKFWEAEEDTLSSEVFKEVVRSLEGLAAHDGQKYELTTRTAKIDDTLFYDLGDKIIRIDGDGVGLDPNPPIVFHRLVHQKLQVEPTGGNCQKVFEFLNLTDENQKILFLITLATCFIPGFPHPMFVFYGPQGSAKTTATRIIKDLVDPSYVETLTAPDNIREFTQQASHHALISYDNLSYMPAWLSDAMSRTITGAGFTKRVLYTDDEDILYNFQRPIVINGINLVVDKPDLMDRSILFQLERIPEGVRKDEKNLFGKYEITKPGILGAIFKAISEAIPLYGKQKPQLLPRMADFYLWGLALAEPLGIKVEDFERAYKTSIQQLNDEALEANPVSLAIIELAKDGEWEGAPQELFEFLNEKAEKLKIDIKSRYWPKDPRMVWKRIEKVKHNLEVEGIRVERDRTGGGQRIIKISYLSQELDQKIDKAKKVFSDNTDNTDDASLYNRGKIDSPSLPKSIGKQ